MIAHTQQTDTMTSAHRHANLVGIVDIDDDEADDLLFLEQIIHFYVGLESRIYVVLDPFGLPHIMVLVVPVM